jgi:hypothetical protein
LFLNDLQDRLQDNAVLSCMVKAAQIHAKEIPVFDRILIAKVGWADLYQDDGVQSCFSGGAGYERFNFQRQGDHCFAAIPGKLHPVKDSPISRGGWLVMFIAQPNAGDPYLPVGWFEHATIERGDQPHGKIDPQYRCVYTYHLRAEAVNCYLIQTKLRSLFRVPTFYGRFRTFAYARRPAHRNYLWEEWRVRLAEFADNLASLPLELRPITSIP